MGPVPEQFSASGQGMFREGFVVRFRTSADTWIGNFQRGLTGCDAVIDHPHRDRAIVVAGGQGYVIEIGTRRCEGTFGGQIEYIVAVPELDCIVFGNGLWFEGHCGGREWRTPRLSWDGMRGLELRGAVLQGESWRFDETWHPFTVNIESGETSGGSYEEPSDDGRQQQ